MPLASIKRQDTCDDDDAHANAIDDDAHANANDSYISLWECAVVW